MEERTKQEHAGWTRRTGDAPSEFTAWQGDARLIEGVENRGYGGLESTKLKTCSVSNTAGWTDAQIAARLAEVKALIGLPSKDGAVNDWWHRFERDKAEQLKLVLRTAEEIGSRGASADAFYRACGESGTLNIQKNLDFLDSMIAAGAPHRPELWSKGAASPDARGTPADNLEL
jgi:hypothetical protein